MPHGQVITPCRAVALRSQRERRPELGRSPGALRPSGQRACRLLGNIGRPTSMADSRLLLQFMCEQHLLPYLHYGYDSGYELTALQAGHRAAAAPCHC